MKNTQIETSERQWNVFLAPTWEIANNLPFTAHCTVVEEFKNCNSPANTFLPDFVPIRNMNIVASHIDLDTILGIMEILGYRYFIPKEFLVAAEFVDLNGPHHIYKFSQIIQDHFNAYWSFTAENRAQRVEKLTNISDDVITHIKTLEEIFSLYGDNKDWIEKGKLWAENVQKVTESKLLMETENYRVFSTDGVFCGASYYSPTHRTIAKAVISFNEKFKAITVSCSDGSLDCRALVQKLWGPEAGGHKGIAGSPRGQVMGKTELKRAVYAVKRTFFKSTFPCELAYVGFCVDDYQCYPDCAALKKCVEGVFNWGNTVTFDQIKEG